MIFSLGVTVFNIKRLVIRKGMYRFIKCFTHRKTAHARVKILAIFDANEVCPKFGENKVPTVIVVVRQLALRFLIRIYVLL